MKFGSSILIFLLCLGITSQTTATDRIKRIGKETVFGDISAMTSKEVVVNDRSVQTKIPVGQIKAIFYENEPQELSRARADASQGRFEDALRELGRVDKKKITISMIAADVDFYKALAAAQLALRGKGEIREAGSKMARFVEAHHNNYHWFEANRLVGDLLIANRQYAQAVRYFETLAQAPWPEARLQAAVGKGRALLADGKIDQAANSFKEAIDIKLDQPTSNSPAIADQKTIAQIGLASCTAEKGEPDKAIAQLRKIIDKISPKNMSLSARAYNALGTALRKAGKPYDALLAFLHVDLIFFSNPQEHAEALANLAQLWHEVHKTDRAIQAQEMLRSRYPNSQWASR